MDPTPDMFAAFLGIIAFATALFAGYLILATRGWHGRFSMDAEAKVQKTHLRPTPRIGGVALVAGVLAGACLLPTGASQLTWVLIGSMIPVFVAGLVEDLTRRVSPARRLAAALISGLVLVVSSGWLTPLVEPWIAGASPAFVGAGYLLGGILVAVGLAGAANAVNIIDGFNGLAGGSVIIMAATLATLAAMHGDQEIMLSAIVLGAAMAGFMVLNWPSGGLFLGDAGAYGAGFITAGLAFALAARTEVPMFVAMLLMAHPLYETLFSIYRKRRRNGQSPTAPDCLHLHHLVSRRFGRFLAFGLDHPEWRNPITGALMWAFSLLAASLSLWARGSNIAGVIGLVIFALIYGSFYKLGSLQRPARFAAWARKRGWDEGERYRRNLPALREE